MHKQFFMVLLKTTTNSFWSQFCHQQFISLEAFITYRIFSLWDRSVACWIACKHNIGGKYEFKKVKVDHSYSKYHHLIYASQKKEKYIYTLCRIAKPYSWLTGLNIVFSCKEEQIYTYPNILLLPTFLLNTFSPKMSR